MHVGVNEPCPMPRDPVLADVAEVLRDTGDWGWVVDDEWRLVYMTSEQRLSFGAGVEMVPIVVGEHIFGQEMVAMSAEWRTGPTIRESWRQLLSCVGGLVLADTQGGKDTLRGLADPSLMDMVDDLVPDDRVAVAGDQIATGTTAGEHHVSLRAFRLRDDGGALRGTVLMYKPMAGLSVLGEMAFGRDMGHLERRRAVSRAGRRPAALFFADLEGSSALARTLSTGNYFALSRRLVGATDRCVVEAGGLVGRHVGDGVVAFFPVEIFDSESGAAKACINAARAVREQMSHVASRSGLSAEDLVMRFGLHWGSTLYIGNISTAARSEVTALGDEVNEAARIEACATGGRVLVSKALIERLAAADAATLEIDPDRVTYTQLAALDSATDKARRDAPAIAVCEL